MLQGSVYFREGRAFRNARCIGSKDTAVLSHNRAETAEEEEIMACPTAYAQAIVEEQRFQKFQHLSARLPAMNPRIFHIFAALRNIFIISYLIINFK